MSILKELKRNTNIKIGSRVKTKDSLLQKINKIYKNKNGSFILNKVVNDVIGFRIVDGNYKKNIDKLNKIDIINSTRIRVVDRNLETYKATHIYLKGKNNNCIPVELQIWDEAYMESNLNSHKYYKQGYITDIENYKDLSIREGSK